LSELTKRVLFGVPAAALFLLLTWWGGTPFLLLTIVIAAAVLFEMVGIFNRFPFPAWLPLSLFLGAFLWVMPLLADQVVFVFSLITLLVTAAAVIGRRSPLALRWLSTLFCGLYGPLGLLFFYQVRLIGPGDAGLWFTFALLLMIWGNDVFAYFGGRQFGKRPLAPTVSPNKTWEGFWFGYLGSIVGLLLIWLLVDPFPLDLTEALPMTILVSIFGPMGDLAASKMKRLAGVKDSSRLLPGHGGFLDRFDALILCSPAVYIYLTWVWRVAGQG